MTHVQRITLSEEEGVTQGKLAARWMRRQTAKPADPKRA
jgi:hypothetical protein